MEINGEICEFACLLTQMFFFGNSTYFTRRLFGALSAGICHFAVVFQTYACPFFVQFFSGTVNFRRFSSRDLRRNPVFSKSN